MPDWQERLHEERAQLAQRLSNLARFIESNADFGKLTPVGQARLHVQRSHMRSYLCVLTERIDALERGRK